MPVGPSAAQRRVLDCFREPREMKRVVYGWGEGKGLLEIQHFRTLHGLSGSLFCARPWVRLVRFRLRIRIIWLVSWKLDR